MFFMFAQQISTTEYRTYNSKNVFIEAKSDQHRFSAGVATTLYCTYTSVQPRKLKQQESKGTVFYILLIWHLLQKTVRYSPYNHLKSRSSRVKDLHSLIFHSRYLLLSTTCKTLKTSFINAIIVQYRYSAGIATR